MNGPPPTPAATCRLASNPMPFVQVCGVYQRPRARASSAIVPAVQHPGGQHDVGLMDVERVGLDGGHQLGERAGHLAPRDADPGPGRPERRQAGQVRAGQRLLEPQDVVLGELDGDLARGDRIERGRRVAGHPPALVEVDHDRHRIGDRVPCRRDGREPLLEPARIDPDLERREALVAEAERGLGASRRGEQHPARGVRRDPRGRATEQGRDGHARDLARDVPQCSLERPVATRMEIDGLEDLDLVGDRQRIGADEQVDERVEAVHRVARADADDPLVGLDPHDRGREARAGRGPRRPGRVGRAGHQAVQADRGDAHVTAVSPTRCGAVRFGLTPRSPAKTTSRRVATAMVGGAHTAAVVEFDHVTKHYDVVEKSSAGKGTPGAVNDLSLLVPAGKICCLVGPSGCGKTTSLKMVNRLIEPTSGRILIDGVDASTRS